MSKLLTDVTNNSISLSESLQRMLVIANKTKNIDLVDWCLKEINGYDKYEELPEYRKCVSRNIVYSGFNGGYQITNQPLLPGYLKEDTIKKIKNVGLFENIIEIEKRMDAEKPMFRELNALSQEVYENTKNEDFGIGVQCSSIKQMISSESYSSVYSAVKARIINLLCFYEESDVDLDNLDVEKSANLANENDQIVVVRGLTYASAKKERTILWNVIIPIIVDVLSGVIVWLITKYWC